MSVFLVYISLFKLIALAPQGEIKRTTFLKYPMKQSTQLLTNEQKNTFFSAIKDGKLQEIKRMINENKEYLNAQDFHTEYGPLHFSVIHNKEEIVFFLIEEIGIPIDLKSKNGKTALMLAVENNRYDTIISFLLKKGADIYIEDNQGKCVKQLSTFFDVGRSLIQEKAKQLENLTILIEQGKTAKVSQFLKEHLFCVNQQNSYGKTPLQHAVYFRDLEMAKELVKQGAKINKLNDRDQSPLRVAVSKNWVEGVQWLLEEGADIEAKDKGERSILYCALFGESKDDWRSINYYRQKKDYDIPKEMIDLLIKYKVNLNAKGPNDLSCLMWAIQKGYPHNLIKFLLEKGASMQTKGKDGTVQSALWMEISNILSQRSEEGSSRYDLVHLMIQKGVNIESKNELGLTPLMKAVSEQEIELVEMLLDAEAKVDEKDIFEGTALVYAIQCQNKKLINLLLKFSEEIDIKQNQEVFNFFYQFHQLIREGQLEKVKEQVQDIPYIIKVTGETGKPISQIALESKQFKMLDFLVSEGVSLEQFNQRGQTALMLYVQKGDIDVVKYLIERGINIEKEGQRVLRTAIDRQDKEMVDLLQVYIQKEKEEQIKQEQQAKKSREFHQLIEQGALEQVKEKLERGDEGEDASFYINIQDKDGNTPLHKAIMTQRVDIIGLLLQYKVEMNQKNRQGLTPLSLLVIQNSFVTVELVDKLIQKGADADVQIDITLNKERFEGIDLREHGLEKKVGLVGYILLTKDSQRKESNRLLYFIFNQVKVNKMNRKEMEMIGETFFNAIQTKDTDKVKEYIQHSRNFLKLIDKEGKTVLMQAVTAINSEKNYINYMANDILHWFIQQGADIEGKGRDEYADQTVLLYAMRGDMYESASFLIQEGAECDVVDRRNNTPLKYAITRTCIRSGLGFKVDKIISLCLENNVDLNREGQSYLSEVLYKQDYCLAKKMIECGIDLRQLDEYGFTALSFVVSKKEKDKKKREKQLEFIRFLLEQEGITEIIDQGGQIPLHIAVDNKDEQVIRLLLECNSNSLYVKNNKGETPLDKSVQDSSTHLLKILLYYDTKKDKELYNRLLFHTAKKGWVQSMALLLERYQPEDEVLIEMLKGSSYETGLLILSILPLGIQLPDSDNRNTNTLLELLREGSELDLFQKALSLPVMNRAVFNQEIFPRLIKKYGCYKKLESRERKLLLNQLAQSLTQPFGQDVRDNLLSISIDRGRYHKDTVNPCLRIDIYEADFWGSSHLDEVYQCEVNMHMFINFMYAFNQEERMVLLEEFVQQHSDVYQSLVGSLSRVSNYYSSLFMGISSLTVSTNRRVREVLKTQEKITEINLLSFCLIWLHVDDPIYLQFSKIKGPNQIFNRCITEGSINIFTRYIQTQSDQFKRDFLNRPGKYLTLEEIDVSFQGVEGQQREFLFKERLVKFIEQIILSFPNDQEIISTIINHMSYLESYQQAEVWKLIFNIDPHLIPYKDYPLLMSTALTDSNLKEKLNKQIKNNLGQFKKFFIKDSENYMVKNSDFMNIFIDFCLKDDTQESQEVISAVLKNIEKMKGKLISVIKNIVSQRVDKLDSQFDESIVHVYLLDSTNWPKEINQILERYCQTNQELMQLKSMEEKIFYLSLGVKSLSQTDMSQLSFNQICSVLAYWLKRNQGQVLEEKLFFVQEEREHLKLLRTFMKHVDDFEPDEEFKNDLTKIDLLPTGRIKGSKLSNKELYKQVIYPWAICLYMRNFDFNPSYKYEQPLYSKQKLVSYEQETPCWEMCAWVNTNYSDWGDMFLKYFWPIWNQPHHPLFEKMKKRASILFLELQHNASLQEQLVDTLKNFKEREVLVEEKLQSFLKKKRDEMNIEKLIVYISCQLHNTKELNDFLASASKSNLDWDIFFSFPFFKTITDNHPLLLNQLKEDQTYRTKLLRNLIHPQSKKGISEQELNEFIEKCNQEPQESKAVSCCLWKMYNGTQIREILTNYNPIDWDANLGQYLLSFPLFDEIKKMAPLIFEELQQNTEYQKEFISLLIDIQKEEEENEKQLEIFLESHEDLSGEGLPIEFLLWVTYNEPEKYSFFKNFFESNKSHKACRLFLMNELKLISMICDQEILRRKLSDIFIPLLSEQVLSEEKIENALEDLDRFLKLECDFEYSEFLYKWWSENRSEYKQIEKGSVCLYYLRNFNKAREDDFYEAQQWKHRLLRRTLPHVKSIIRDVEEEWYRQTEQAFSDVEKNLTFESHESRKKHMDIMPSIVEGLSNCASQTQHFMVRVKILFQNEPEIFDDIKEAFCHAAMNYRSDLLRRAAIQHVQHESQSVHDFTEVYRIALKNQWGIPEASHEDITESEDLFAPRNEATIKWFFEKRYQFDRVFFEKILKRSCPDYFFKEGSSRGVPRYAPAFNKEGEIETWDEAIEIFRVEKMLHFLESHELIKREKGVSQEWNERETYFLEEEISLDEEPLELEEEIVEMVSEKPLLAQEIKEGSSDEESLEEVEVPSDEESLEEVEVPLDEESLEEVEVPLDEESLEEIEVPSDEELLKEELLEGFIEKESKENLDSSLLFLSKSSIRFQEKDNQIISNRHERGILKRKSKFLFSKKVSRFV